MTENINYLMIPKYLSPWGTLKTIPRRLLLKVQKYKNIVFGTHEGELEGVKKLEGEGTDVVSLDQGVLRVTPDTELRGTLFNEFVEKPKNKTIRTASEYKQLQKDKNATISDGKIPVSNINLFAGIQDGHFMMDSLSNFNDTTTVIPVRNIKKDTPLISSLYLSNQNLTYLPVLFKDFLKASYTFGKNYLLKPKDIDLASATEIYYEIEKRLGRKPTFEELLNLTSRILLSNSILEKYNIPENINELIGPLTNEEKIKLETIKDSSNESLLNLKVPVASFGIINRLNEDSIPMLLNTLILDEFLKSMDRDNNVHNDSVIYSLIYPKQKDVDKYMTYKKLDKKPFNNAKKLIKKYFAEKVNPEIMSLSGLLVITPEGDTIPIGNYNAGILDKKMVLGNPKGGMFIADFKNLSQEQLDEQVNPYLKEKPSWLFLSDMGLYSLYGLQNGIDPKMLRMSKKYGFDVNEKPEYSDYWNLFLEGESKAPYNPDEHYLVGVKKSGGRIHIKPENKGKFTEYCGGKVTDECIQRAKRSGNKKLIKRAVFALNSRKWKH